MRQHLPEVIYLAETKTPGAVNMLKAMGFFIVLKYRL